jgi:hypothetical protein
MKYLYPRKRLAVSILTLALALAGCSASASDDPNEPGYNAERDCYPTT